MRKLLLVLANIVLYLPNLALVAMAFMDLLMGSSHSRNAPDAAEFSMYLRILGLGTLVLTIIGMRAQRALVKLPIACLCAGLLFFIYIHALSTSGTGDGKGFLFGTALVFGVALATIAGMLLFRILKWAASKMS